MKYQFEIKVHGQIFDIRTDEGDFALYLNCTILDDFEIEGNNSRLIALRSYVKVSYQLFLHEQAVDEMIHKIELLT